ncbi:MAG: DUF4012 domain-containing protein [Patescibacteria group bacterium]|nr:DUF4012 domain-containing protein [Patescibacteria group bacterium]
MVHDKKIKFDFLKKEKASPHLIDLRKKEKSKIKFLDSLYLFRKICLILSLVILIPITIFLVKLSLSQIMTLKIQLIENQFYSLDKFFLGLESLKNFNFSKAEENFNLAKKDFSSGLEKIEKSNFSNKFLLKIHPRSKTMIHLLEVLKDSSEIGLILAKTGNEVLNFVKIEEKEEKDRGILPPEILNFDFLTVTKILKEKTALILPLVEKIEKNFSQINLSYLPPNFQPIFKIVKEEVPLLKKNTQTFIIFLENFEKIVDHDRMKRYLIVFQNNNEIRATGGFLGTYALIDFANGQIKNFEMPAGGTYDLAGWLTVKVAPPAPFFIAQPKWMFHDANWFPDFPTSARKLIWFFERSGGPSVDGVIAINAELISDFLTVLGEISLPHYQKVINAQNFILETQKAIEIERREKRKPKQFLVDLTPILIKKIIQAEPDKFFQIFEKIIEGLSEKKILLYSVDEKIEKFFQEKNWTGEIKETPFDYLLVVATNVNGTKTEGVIEQKIFYQVEVNLNGSMIGTLTIRRKHYGQKDDFFTGKKDLSWLRVYLPKGTVFLGSQRATKKELAVVKPGFNLDEDLKNIEKEIIIDQVSGTRITEEFGKTCFGNFLEIAPGEEKEISFQYLLPFKLNLEKKPTSYSLLIQKQPGRKSDFQGEIILPEKRKIIWQYPASIQEEDETIKFKTDLKTDKFFAFIIE